MNDYLSPHVLIIALTFFLAGIVKGVTGMGLPTVAMGILGAITSPVSGSFAVGHSVLCHQFLAVVHGAGFPGPGEKALADDARYRGWHTRRLMASHEHQY